MTNSEKQNQIVTPLRVGMALGIVIGWAVTMAFIKNK